MFVCVSVFFLVPSNAAIIAATVKMGRFVLLLILCPNVFFSSALCLNVFLSALCHQCVLDVFLGSVFFVANFPGRIYFAL